MSGRFFKFWNGKLSQLTKDARKGNANLDAVAAAKEAVEERRRKLVKRMQKGATSAAE